MLLRSGRLDSAAWAVTDRNGGVSRPPYDALNLADHVGDDPGAVATNRERFATALGLDTAATAYMRQVHGTAVVAVGPTAAAQRETGPEADVLVSTTPGLAVVVLSADCVPVLLAAPGVVAAVHAGRRGVASGVVTAAIGAITDAGAAPAQVQAVVGPAICAACYEVPAAMRDEVAAVVPAAAATTRTGTPALDLPAAVEAQLHAAGVSEVARQRWCTAESRDLFSHRRDGVTGRLAAAVWLAA